MHVSSLILQNFRNFSSECFEFCPTFNLFIGKNAQGKTNIVESIGVFSWGKSFRTNEFRDMIGKDKDHSFAEVEVSIKQGDDRLRVELDESKKAFYRNNKKTNLNINKRLICVLFAPEEIILLRDSPAARRKYIDQLTINIYPNYKGIIQNYEKVVIQRNRILQDEEFAYDSHILNAWDEQLVMLGAKVICTRSKCLAMLNEYLPSKYRTIAPDDKEAIFAYVPKCGEEYVSCHEDEVELRLRNQLEEKKRDESIRRITLVGPHRDEIEARLGEEPLKRFGSQGQHRSFILALKIAEIELLNSVYNEMPVLLLDDVASELDEERNRFFFEYLNGAKGQVFVTGTNREDIRIFPSSNIKEFRISEGAVVL